jgi:hypothetical protein
MKSSTFIRHTLDHQQMIHLSVPSTVTELQPAMKMLNHKLKPPKKIQMMSSMNDNKNNNNNNTTTMSSVDTKSSGIFDYRADLSSIRAMDVSVQVQSTMFSAEKEPKKSIPTSNSIAIQTETPLSAKSIMSQQQSTNRDVGDHHPMTYSHTTTMQSVSYEASAYTAEDEHESESENDESDHVHQSFTLVDLLPNILSGKSIPITTTHHQPTSDDLSVIDKSHTSSMKSLSNPWQGRYYESFAASQGSANSLSQSTVDMSRHCNNYSILASSRSSSLGKSQRIFASSANEQQMKIDVDREEKICNPMAKTFLSTVSSSNNTLHTNSASASGSDTGSVHSTNDESNPYHNAHLDITFGTDYAIAHFTNSTLLQEDEDDYDQQSLSTNGAETTFTLDQSLLTKSMMVSMNEYNSSNKRNDVIPKFVVKSLKRDQSHPFEIKELAFETAPGEYTTIMLNVYNHRNHIVNVIAKTALVRVEPIIRDQVTTCYSMLPDHIEDGEYFKVDPDPLQIRANEEAKMFITFAPPIDCEGIFSGALQIRNGRKTYTMLLRGESAYRNSVQTTPQSLVSRSSQQELNQHQQQSSPSLMIGHHEANHTEEDAVDITSLTADPTSIQQHSIHHPIVQVSVFSSLS